MTISSQRTEGRVLVTVTQEEFDEINRASAQYEMRVINLSEYARLCNLVKPDTFYFGNHYVLKVIKQCSGLWMPISEAPKEGSILACLHNFSGQEITVMFTNWDGNKWINSYGVTVDPVYWVPSPPKPEPSGA